MQMGAQQMVIQQFAGFFSIPGSVSVRVCVIGHTHRKTHNAHTNMQVAHALSHAQHTHTHTTQTWRRNVPSLQLLLSELIIKIGLGRLFDDGHGRALSGLGRDMLNVFG